MILYESRNSDSTLIKYFRVSEKEAFQVFIFLKLLAKSYTTISIKFAIGNVEESYLSI